MNDPYFTLDQAVRGWDRHERAHGRQPVVAYDLDPPASAVCAAGRGETARALTELADTHPDAVRGHLAYLSRLTGESIRPLDAYVAVTQQTPLQPVGDAHLQRRRDELANFAAAVGVTFGPELPAQLTATETPVGAADLEDVISLELDRWLSVVATYVRSDVTFDVAIERVDEDVYWSYWLDGAGRNARMRINMRHAQFTLTQARQFALHELCGHALQCASWSARRVENGTARFPATHCVHLGQQPAFEGIGQALGLLVARTDKLLAARTRLTLYSQLVYGRAHRQLAFGADRTTVERELRRWLPWWDPAAAGRFIADRRDDALLSSYLWSYPAGAAFFWQLADAHSQVARDVLTAAYDRPLTLTALAGVAADCNEQLRRHRGHHG